MDLDSLKKDFDDLKRRVTPMLEEYEGHLRRRDAAGHPDHENDGSEAMFERRAKRREARQALEAGDVAKAGELIGLERAHGGEEADDSYERRVKADIHGAAAADAVKPRPEDGVEVGSAGAGDGQDQASRD